VRRVAAAGLVGLVVLGVLMLLPPLFGYERYVIDGGSMGSTIPRGSIAYEEVVPSRAIGVGDVITYRPPGHARLVTHRVVWMRRGQLRTRGDANSARDPWTFRLARATQARVVFHVPVAGYALAALSVRAVRVAVIGLPALAIAVASLAAAFRAPPSATRVGAS
jgi:signal peptidase I